MLAIAAPYIDGWNSWFADTGNTPEGTVPLRDLVDTACRDAGRDPSEVARTVAVLVRMTGGKGRRQGDTVRAMPEPLSGPPEAIAAGLRAYAAAGIAEVQLVLDPITPAALDELGPVLEALDRE
jgi:alkanesulfonate monooxygenase SsuD/methylene tetrahydromethanopterin reductase-like flavin-dependent oxidoreductase (luciferase family)